MDAQELRTFSVDELKGRVRQWKDELFRMKFKAQSSENKNTSLFGKLRKDIARANTIVNEKILKGEVQGAPQIAPVDLPKKVKKAPAKATEKVAKSASAKKESKSKE